MTVPGFTRWLLLIAVSATLTACGTATQGNPTDAATSSAASLAPQVTSEPQTEPSDVPATEPTGVPEPPQPPKPQDVSVTLPQLPIGGDADDEQAIQQCVTVNWLGDKDVPAGISISVTTIQITPAGVFGKNGGGCGGKPGCDSFAFTSQRTRCSVSVTAKGTDGKDASLSIGGKVQCPAENAQQCKDFAGQVNGQSISLHQPFEPPTSTVDTTTTETSPTTSTS